MVSIGPVHLSGRFVLAPLAGVNCTAFRLLCKENGANLIYTQMIDADIINERTYRELERFLNIQPQEHPINVQIIGSSKKSLVDAVKKVELFADIIDLNIGCIEDDYLAKNAGASLLKDPDHMLNLFSSMVNATDKPVTAKIRIGWDAHSINAVNIAQLLEEAGAAAICIHGRTAQQKYAGRVNWTIMKQVKEKVKVPIIANGDVDSLEAGMLLLSKTNCDLVMIGRESMHCPWVFSNKPVDIKQQILHFIDLYTQHEARLSVQEVADHVFWMLRDYETTENTKKVHLLRTIPQLIRFVSRLQ
jgi:nifR3 family TIM-barrel protein